MVADAKQTGTKRLPDATRRQGGTPPPRDAGDTADAGEALPMDRVMRAGIESMQAMTKLPCATVVAMEPHEGGWHLQMEMVEKESIPRGMDILGIYDAWLGSGGNLLRFSRYGVRRRADVSGDL